MTIERDALEAATKAISKKLSPAYSRERLREIARDAIETYLSKLPHMPSHGADQEPRRLDNESLPEFERRMFKTGGRVDPSKHSAPRDQYGRITGFEDVIRANETMSADEVWGVQPVPGYESLDRVLRKAYDQSARGKGKERHGNGLPFDKQPIMNIARMVGLGGHTYQISKKAQEATSMAAREAYPAAKAEILGIIVYAAAAYLLLEEKESS